jgi:hypothetical protein
MGEALGKDRTHIAQLGRVPYEPDTIRHLFILSAEVIRVPHTCAVSILLPSWIEISYGIGHVSLRVNLSGVMVRVL